MTDVPILTVADVAERWSCSERLVRDIINRGELPAFWIGKLVRVRSLDIAAYEDSRAVLKEQPAPEPYIPRRPKSRRSDKQD